MTPQKGTFSIPHQALCIIAKPSVNSNWNYSPETLNLSQNRQIYLLCDLETWHMPPKNNRAPLLLLSNVKLYASFCRHMWIQTGVTFRKRINWVLTSVTLTCDLWHWAFVWSSLLSLVITPEKFMMMRYHCFTTSLKQWIIVLTSNLMMIIKESNMLSKSSRSN